MELIISIFFLVLIFVIIATQWVKGIDYMEKNHPNYKGEDLFDEEVEPTKEESESTDSETTR